MTEQQFNTEVMSMAKATRQRMLFELARLNIKQTGALMASLKVANRKKNGLIYHVKYEFVRQGLFVKLGVGRGYGKKHGKYRQKKDWYTNELTKSEKEIGNFAAKFKADETIKVLAGLISK